MTRIVGALLATAWCPGTAHGADWPLVQTHEERDSPLLRPMGVVQVTGEGIVADSVRGLRGELAEHEGKLASFNATSANGSSSWGMAVRRARIGVRGHVPGTEARATYFVLADFGTSSLTRNGPTVTDASVTLAYLPGLRLRMGKMRLPTMDEGAESNAQAAEWINASLPASTLVSESPVRSGRFDGNASGFRDVGIQTFDTFRRDHVAFSWAAMVSNGGSGALDTDDAKDVSGRATFAWVFAGTDHDPHRQELAFFTWGQTGSRDLDGVRHGRIRSGFGVHLEKEPVRLRVEFVHASGMIFDGPTPPFVGSPVHVRADGRADGATLQLRVGLFRGVRLGVRGDQVVRDATGTEGRTTTRSFTPLVEWDPVHALRLQGTCEFRRIDVDGATADERRVYGSLGPRLSLQITAIL
ncbi:MAG: hypothetical protein U0169_10750 [Polyangiaceae bacterium]